MNQVRLMPLQIHKNGIRGDISVMEDLPFRVKRIFCIYNVPADVLRGGHAHKKCHQFFISINGAILIKIEGGIEYVLDCPEYGLYVPPKNIVHLTFLDENANLIVLASEKYDKNDYLYEVSND